MIDSLPGDDILVTIFGRLFESELGTLEHLVVSSRTDDGTRTLDGTAAFARLLGEARPDDPAERVEPRLHALHEAMLAAWPEHTAVVSGLALHLRDLLVEGLALPETTSMMRKRGVTHLSTHLVEPGALEAAELERTLAHAHDLAAANAMNHVLIVVSDGMVHVAGRSARGTMAHWSSVEFSARVECMRVEERVVHGIAG